MTPESAPESRVQIRRTFHAPAARVYAAWTEHQQLEHWMCRDAASHTIRYVEFKAAVGGGFVLHISTPEGDVYLQHAEFLEMAPQQRLVFKWFWEKIEAGGVKSAMRSGDTKVTVEFFDHGEETEVVLTHEGFTDEAERRETDQGWSGCFDVLARWLA